jgi:hypothetical protein
MLKQTLQWWARFHFKFVCKAVTSAASAHMATAAGELPTDRIVSRGKTLRRRRAQVGEPASSSTCQFQYLRRCQRTACVSACAHTSVAAVLVARCCGPAGLT